MPSQHLPPSYKSSKEWEYILGRQLPYIDSNKITLTTGTIGVDVPEAFIQMKFKKGRERKSITIQTLLGCAVF